VAHKPTVFVFATAYYPFIGGVEVAIEEVAKRLAADFHFVVITSRFRRDLPKREARPEATIVRIGFGASIDKWLLPLWGIWFCVSRLMGPKRSRSENVFWGVDISQGALAAGIVKLFFPHIPLVFTVQYGEGEERLARGRFGMTALAFRFILARADRVTAISSSLFGVARQYGYQGIGKVVPNGVDLQNFQRSILNFQKRGRVVITVSRLVSKNGIDILIKAIAEVKKSVPDILLHIIGDGPERERLELYAARCTLQANIKFFGAIPHEQIPHYLHAAAIFVRPSRSEGMGNSFVEALAAGLPIIGTPVGGITDIIKEKKTGLLARVDDSHDLAEKILLLLRDRELSLSIVEEGKKMVDERFSWNKVAGSYRAVFGEVSINGRSVGHDFVHVLTRKRYRVSIKVPGFKSMTKVADLSEGDRRVAFNANEPSRHSRA